MSLHFGEERRPTLGPLLEASIETELEDAERLLVVAGPQYAAALRERIRVLASLLRNGRR